MTTATDTQLTRPLAELLGEVAPEIQKLIDAGFPMLCGRADRGNEWEASDTAIQSAGCVLINAAAILAARSLGIDFDWSGNTDPSSFESELTESYYRVYRWHETRGQVEFDVELDRHISGWSFRITRFVDETDSYDEVASGKHVSESDARQAIKDAMDGYHRQMIGYRWKLLFAVPGGHSFFRDENCGRMAVADRSGSTPNLTDDGVLWLATHQVVKDRHDIIVTNERGQRINLGGVSTRELAELRSRGIVSYVDEV